VYRKVRLDHLLSRVRERSLWGSCSKVPNTVNGQAGSQNEVSCHCSVAKEFPPGL
jgi:hypothetical protein